MADHDAGRPEGRAELGDLLLGAHAVADRGQAGQEQAGIEPALGQHRRQGGDHVAEPAGLDQREDFGGHMEDLHAAISSSILRVIRVIPPGLR